MNQMLKVIQRSIQQSNFKKEQSDYNFIKQYEGDSQ